MKTSVNSMMRVCHFIYNNDEAIENKIAKSEPLFFFTHQNKLQIVAKDTTEYKALLAVNKVNSLQNKCNDIFLPNIDHDEKQLTDQ